MVHVLYEAIGSVVTVEMESRENVRGRLVGMDRYQNLSLETEKGRIVVPGKKISFVVLPPLIELSLAWYSSG
jgi:small nuclear ribonucleoprotein (snRNP)-like protein